MKIILTGATGNLGQAILNKFKNISIVPFFGKSDLDITNFNEVKKRIRNIKNTTHLIHAAALTNVDECETNKFKSKQINLKATKIIIDCCKEFNIIPIFISSDYVHCNKKKTGYTENQVNNFPCNNYGFSKALSEYYISSVLTNYYIIRTSWLFGGTGNNFVRYIHSKLKNKQEIHAVFNHKGNPTYTEDLAQSILNIITSNLNYGIYHITNSEETTWYDWACYIREILKIKDVKINKISWEDLNLPARRPENSVLINTKLKENRSWKDATREYLKSEEFK